MTSRAALLAAVLWTLTAAGVAPAQSEPSPPAPPQPTPSPPAEHDPLFVGFGTEPATDFAGRTVTSIHAELSRLFSDIGDVRTVHPGLQPVWEFPLAAAVMLVQHEVVGHGGRAREQGLGPSYQFSLDFSGATSTDKPPRTNNDGTLLAAGGAEADGVLAHGILLDLLRPEGVDGSKLALAFLAKLDLSVYVATAKSPDGESFTKQYREGNDVVYWLVSRQGARREADPAAVWNGDYEPDFSDRGLRRTYDAARTTAIWNVLDPSLIATMVAYFRHHVLAPEVRVQAPLLRAGDHLGFTLGTRGALGPREVTRFLDLYAVAGSVVVDAYVRDLESLDEKTYGEGLAVRNIPIGGAMRLAAAFDQWREPRAAEGPAERSAWNAALEVQARFGERIGFAAQIGRKTAGFFPGLPVQDGNYFELGLTGSF
jgi:hypothetical protein